MNRTQKRDDCGAGKVGSSSDVALDPMQNLSGYSDPVCQGCTSLWALT